MAATGVRVGEAQARRHSATGPHDEIAPEAPRPRQAALTAEGSSLIPGSRRAATAPEYGSGRSFTAGGNRLRGRHHDPAPGESTSMTVTWSVPPNCTIDFGDGEEFEAGPLGAEVVHVYEPPAGTTEITWIFEARTVDQYDRPTGWCKFSLPHHATGGIVIEGHSANTVPSP
jgi:hypothetical protein